MEDRPITKMEIVSALLTLAVISSCLVVWCGWHPPGYQRAAAVAVLVLFGVECLWSVFRFGFDVGERSKSLPFAPKAHSGMPRQWWLLQRFDTTSAQPPERR